MTRQPAPRTHKEFIAWHLARRREMSLGRLAALPCPLPRLLGHAGHWRTDLEIAADLTALSKLIVVERDVQGKRLVAAWRAWRRLALSRPGPLSVQIELRAVRQRGASTDVLFRH